jgi:uncharacterized glyoxalase superfamily protein PhnB
VIDPLDTLRLPVVPVTPRPAFAAELRGRLAGWLGGDDDPTAAPAPAPAAASAPARPTIIPYLSLRRGTEAIGWYVDVLGAEPLGDPIVEDNGRVGHMELRLGDATFALADEYPELDIVGPESRGGSSMRLTLAVDDCDATYGRAVAAGAVGLRPPEDQFYGARAATIQDPFGHVWNLQQFTEEVSQEVMQERLTGSEFAVVDLGSREPAPSAPAAHDQNRAPDRVGDLGYFTIGAPDPDVTADFFRQLFGWVVRQGTLPEGRHIESIAPPGGIHGGAEPGYTMYFRVDDLATSAQRVRELGGEVLTMDDWASGSDAECRDPQGVPFHLWKPAPGY